MTQEGRTRPEEAVSQVAGDLKPKDGSPEDARRPGGRTGKNGSSSGGGRTGGHNTGGGGSTSSGERRIGGGRTEGGGSTISGGGRPGGGGSISSGGISLVLRNQDRRTQDRTEEAEMSVELNRLSQSHKSCKFRDLGSNRV